MPTSFPDSIGDELASALDNGFDGDYTIVRRPIRSGDPAQTIGIFAFDWTPTPGSAEMNSAHLKEPTLQTYTIRIQLLRKDADEVSGRASAALDTKILRTVLYRDSDLQVSLGQLTEDLLGSRERMQRWGLRNQRFFNNQVGAQFLFLTQTDFWAETESTVL